MMQFLSRDWRICLNDMIERGVPGIGLELAICRAIVTLHGGTITAHRRPTAGAEFIGCGCREFGLGCRVDDVRRELRLESRLQTSARYP
jgi:hypothetical protein